MSASLSILERSLRDGAGLREQLTRFLYDAPSEHLLAALEGWNTPAPIGKFEVLDGLVIEAGSDTSTGPVIELRTGERVELSKTSETERRALFTLRDGADPAGSEFPYRATLALHRGRGWVLLRIDAMCASCFGSGIVGSELRPCDSCDAVGWGLAECETVRISSLT